MTEKFKPDTGVKKPNNSPTEAHKSVWDSLGELGVGITHTATEASKILLDTSIGAGIVAAKEAYKLIAQGTQTTGDVVSHISENWLIRNLTGVLNLNWVISPSENVDLEKAEVSVNRLREKYPHESPSEIAHRIMLDKATKAGGIGLASSILPGAAAALLAIDLAATTKLQAEMLYEIAAAYGLNLKETARKGEVLAIFGLGLGGGHLLRLGGLGLLRNLPFAGAAIATSSNATMIYSLGYAACRFYEAKLDESTSLTSPETLTTLQAESEEYLETALLQEAIVDQILVQIILDIYPGKNREQILADLQAVNLSHESLQTIAENIKSPQPLDELVKKLNSDFAVPLLARCREIAQRNPRLTSPLLARCREIALEHS